MTAHYPTTPLKGHPIVCFLDATVSH